MGDNAQSPGERLAPCSCLQHCTVEPSLGQEKSFGIVGGLGFGWLGFGLGCFGYFGVWGFCVLVWFSSLLYGLVGCVKGIVSVRLDEDE